MSKLNIEQLAILKLLSKIEGVGSARIRQLYAHFKSFENILKANYNSLLEVETISHILAKKINSAIHVQRLPLIQKIGTSLSELRKINAKCVTFWDDDYPEILRNIYDAPLVIYIKGSLEPEDLYSIGIVGTRTPTNYGRMQAERFSEVLSQQKITIVSGMARGIDSIAHRVALKNSSRTIAVIGSGLNVIYPPENKLLFEEIAEKGAIISEYELGTGPDAVNFPRRNRIIAGLSLGILVIESGLVGGALQTAAYAFDQNKEIFAIPGNLGMAKSEGTNMLIRKDMARLVITPEDLIYDMGIKIKPVIKQRPTSTAMNPGVNLFEQKLIQHLDIKPKHIDEISTSSCISTADCLVYLLSLEFKGLVKQYPGKMFSLS
ncbi:MAG: DNA-processing protein DprA [Bacteroidota bacterium]|nr:DNA-processing protein DprA [Bacteroidota bacterium]